MLVLSISFLVAFLDQLTKFAVRANIQLGSQISIIPGFFNLTYVQNTGAAWGMLTGWGFFLISLSILMLVVLVVFRRQIIEDIIVHKIAMGLMIAGIVGNLIDRVRLGYVVDFLDFYCGIYQAHFPSFNVADSAICIGVGLYLISGFIMGRKNGNTIPDSNES